MVWMLAILLGCNEKTSDTASVNIVEVTSIAFNQQEYNTEQDLQVWVEISGAQNTLELDYEWHIHNLEGDVVVQSGDSPVLEASFTTKKDDVYVVVQAFADGQEEMTMTSNTITIMNSNPSEPTISMNPQEPIQQEDDLICTVIEQSEDPDDDQLQYIYVWTDSAGVEQQNTQSAATSDIFDKENVRTGTWTCTVQAFDGEGYSSSKSEEIEVLACDMTVDHDCDGVLNADPIPRIEVGDFAYTYWPSNFRPTANGNIFSEIRHFRTGRFGLAYDVQTASLYQFGVWDQIETIEEAGLAENSDIDVLDMVSTEYRITQEDTTYWATDFLSEQGASGNPSQLIDMGRWMQNIEVPEVLYDSSDFIGSTNIAVAPRHFVLTHRVQSQATQSATTIEILLGGDFLQSLDQEEWLIADRALQLTNSEGKGWVFIAPSCTGCGLLRTDSGSLQVYRSKEELKVEEEISLSLLVLPTLGLNQSQLDMYLYPDTIARVAFAQLDSQGTEREQREYAEWDEERGVYRVILDALSAMEWASNVADWSNPAVHNWYNRHRIQLESYSQDPISIPIAFDGPVNTLASITSGAGMLRDDFGEPIGLPIQVSKNWHEPGYWPNWYHFYTSPTLNGTEEHALDLTLVNSKWGEVYAASHAQLSLIGWGVNQQWDESALGAWGESITYDPDLTLNRAMVDDVRPFLVDCIGPWSWTGNVGGADFLKYTDHQGVMHRLSRMRTNYAQTGPNLTDVRYMGITDDGAIEAQIQTQLGRTDDIVRAYYTIQYTFLEDVDYLRLAFFQIAADQYGDNGFTQAAYGNQNEIVAMANIPQTGATGYESETDRGIMLEGSSPWVFLYNSIKGGGNLPEDLADVGFVIRSFHANIDGESIETPHINIYRTNNGWHQYSFELGLSYDPNHTVIPAGSTIEVIVEYVVVPNDIDDYYGTSTDLLERTGWGSAELMRQLAAENEMLVNTTIGNVQKLYPLLLEAESGLIATQFVLTGGHGYTPISISGLERHDGWILESNNNGTWERIVQEVYGNDYWQSLFDPLSERYTLTFNVQNQGSTEYRLRWTD